MVVKKSTKRTCITCTAKGVNKDEVPLWSKKDGLYSMLPKILNCEDKYNPHKNELEEETPEIVGQELTIPLEIKETDRWVFYWAAEAGSSVDGDKPDDPATSYGSESNRGLVKTDKDGNAILVLNCPKLYKEEGQLYPRHVHYTVLTDDDVWATTIGTLEIMCKLSYETMKNIVRKKSYLILNALSSEAFEEKHIPTSILCDYKSLEGLTKQKKDGIIKQLLKESLSDFPSIKEFLHSIESKKGSKDSIKEVPIIVYCAHEECESSSKLADHLYDCGYYNVMEYPGGLKEWFSESDLFEDADTEESVIEEEEEELLDVDDVDDVDDIDDEEIIVYDGVTYIHKLDDNEILTVDELDVVGIYDGEDIEWNTPKEYKKHLQRVKQGGKGKKEEAASEAAEAVAGEAAEAAEAVEAASEEEASEAAEASEEGEEEPFDTQESSSDEEEEEEEEGKGALNKNMNESFLQSKKVSELKKLLDKMQETSLKRNAKKKDVINCLLKCKPVFRGGGEYNDNIIYGGSLNQSTLNQQFRGWGFTFLN